MFMSAEEGPLGLGGLFGGPDLFGPGFNLSFGIGAFPFSLFWTSFNVGAGGAVRNPHGTVPFLYSSLFFLLFPNSWQHPPFSFDFTVVTVDKNSNYYCRYYYYLL